MEKLVTKGLIIPWSQVRVLAGPPIHCLGTLRPVLTGAFYRVATSLLRMAAQIGERTPDNQSGRPVWEAGRSPKLPD